MCRAPPARSVMSIRLWRAHLPRLWMRKPVAGLYVVFAVAAKVDGARAGAVELEGGRDARRLGGARHERAPPAAAGGGEDVGHGLGRGLLPDGLAGHSCGPFACRPFIQERGPHGRARRASE